MVVDQGIVDGDALSNVFLLAAEQLRGDLFQLRFSQEAENVTNMFRGISRGVCSFPYLSTMTMPSL